MPKLVNTDIEITGIYCTDIPVYFEDTDNGEIIEDLFDYAVADDNEVISILGEFNNDSQISNYKINKGFEEYTCDNCKKRLTKEEWIKGKGFCKECVKKYNN